MFLKLSLLVESIGKEQYCYEVFYGYNVNTQCLVFEQYLYWEADGGGMYSKVIFKWSQCFKVQFKLVLWRFMIRCKIAINRNSMAKDVSSKLTIDRNSLNYDPWFDTQAQYFVSNPPKIAIIIITNVGKSTQYLWLLMAPMQLKFSP